MSEPVFISALLIVFGTFVIISGLRFYRRVLELKNERRISVSTDELQARLHRIEMAVEATAIEVERSSEANRFMAKLLAERLGAANPVRKPERVITPH
jgi:hypothetical protein